MIPGTVELVDVEWILKNLQATVDYYDDGEGNVLWQDMIEAKGSDYAFESLLNAITTQGFRVPIVLSVKGFEEASSRYDGKLSLGNGHHRMVAALLLFLHSIPVFWSDGSDFMCLNYSGPEDDELVSDDRGDYEDIMDGVFYA